MRKPLTWTELQYQLTHYDECGCGYDEQKVVCKCDCHAFCTECGEMIYVRYWKSQSLGWHHVGSGVVCCGDPDEGDHRVATSEIEL